jgi:predicted chitinase
MANSSAPATPTPPLKQITFAFPFRRKGQGNGSAAADFTDEHEIFRLLAQESSGSFPVGSGGMWHGGIHVSEAGAGQSMDFKGGVRCIADGEVVAWRLNRAYLVSHIPAHDGQPAIDASYSTGFALVKHVMEFPRGRKLTFFSLYMHLQDYAGYESDPSLPWPAYWAAKVEVTQDAADKSQPGAGGQTAPDGQTGLNVRASKPHGTVLGILPRGTQVSLSTREGLWGQIADDPGALYARTAGAYVDSRVAKDKWIFLGKEPGHSGPVVKNVMPDSSFDCVNVVPEEKRVKVKAGDVIGYPGRCDSLRNSPSGRMVHIEVFCDDGIKQFIEDGRNWVDAHVSSSTENTKQWNQLGVSPEPTILRVNTGVQLYEVPPPGQAVRDQKPTDVIQVYGLATLPHDASHMVMETQAGNDGQKRSWWKVDSADMQRQPITGWVREQSFAGGMVTREHAQSWIDFKCHDEDHDPTHTIFANTQNFVDFKTDPAKPDRGAKDKLSQLMASIYGELYPAGDGTHAADELSNMGQGPQGSGFPWAAFRASRLIPKHESEWANPAKWQELVSAIEQHTGPQPEHEEERKRIARLVWWDEVKAGVPGFPGSDVFHIHPVALVGNFKNDPELISMEMLIAVEPGNAREYYVRILPHLNKYAKAYAVNKPKRIAHFLSQAAHESHLRSSEENLNYSAKQMRKTFGCKGGPKRYNEHQDECTLGRLRDKLWTQEFYYAHNAEHLGNYVYADRNGNGDESSGDGFKYRGRGLIQVTGKDGYQAFQNEHNHRSPDDQQDFVTNPGLVSSNLEYGVESAFVFWSRTNLNSTADSGTVVDVTQTVNGGQNGYPDRLARYNRVAPLLGLSPE